MPDHLDLDAFEAEIAVKPWNENLALKALVECRRLTDENAQLRKRLEGCEMALNESVAMGQAYHGEVVEQHARIAESRPYEEEDET